MFSISPVKVKSGNREMPEADGQTAEILSGVIIEQKFTNITEDINEIAIVFNRLYSLEEKTNIVIELRDGGSVLASSVLNADDIEGSHRTYIKPDSTISGYVGKELELRIYTDSTAGTGLSLMTNSGENSSFTYGDQKIDGTICFSITGK